MKLGLTITSGVILLAMSTMGWAADPPAATQPTVPAAAAAAADAVEVAPGIKLNSNGMVDVSDVTAEGWHFDSGWTLAEQHDVFKPTPAPAGASSMSHVVSGPFKIGDGGFKLTETLDPADGGAKYSATLTSDKEITTNELAVAFTLPVASFGGKQILINQDKVSLPAAAAAAGQAGLLDQDGVQKIELPMTDGTLIITGNLTVHLQDDREWNDQRYCLRVHFTPNNGDIKDAKIEFQMKWKPAAK